MRKICLLMLFVLLTGPAAVHGQTAWDAPLLLPPRPAPGVGVFLTDMHAGGLGLLATWRSPAWNYGLRFGISDGGAGEDLAVFGGVDYMGMINTASTDFPLDIDWVFGMGLGASNGVRLSVPLGLTIGASLQTEEARFIPFVTPRIHLDGRFGREDRGSRMDLGFALDLGLDLRLASGPGFFAGRSFRFAASVGDRDAIGVGMVF